jgi:hypothetical protein
MKYTRLVVVLLAVVAVSAAFAGGHAGMSKAEEKAEGHAMYACPMHPEIIASWETKCPKCGTVLKKQKAAMMGQGPEVSPHDPQMLLTMAEKLALTGEQVEHLEVIQAQSREDAKAVLTQEQVKKIEAMTAEAGKMKGSAEKHHHEMMEGSPKKEHHKEMEHSAPEEHHKKEMKGSPTK